MKKRNLSHKSVLIAKQRTENPKIGRWMEDTSSLLPLQTPFLILVFGILLSGCSDLSGEAVELMTPPTAEFTFDRYEVVIGPAKRQTVLTGFLLEGPIAELAIDSFDHQ